MYRIIQMLQRNVNDHTFPMFNGLHCISFLRYWHNNESSWAVPSEGFGFVDGEASVVLSPYDRPHHSKCPFICVTWVSLFLLVYNGSLIFISHYCQTNNVECGFLVLCSHPKVHFFECHMYWYLTKWFLSFLQLENYFSSLKNPKLRVRLVWFSCLWVFGQNIKLDPIPQHMRLVFGSRRSRRQPGGASRRTVRRIRATPPPRPSPRSTR